MGCSREHTCRTQWKFDRLLTLVETCFHKYRFSLNIGTGKTECMIQYRGKGALDARDSLYQNEIDDQGEKQRNGPFWRSSTGRVLEAVSDCKHVGSFVTVTGGLMREAAHRTKASQSSFCSLRRKIFETHSLLTRIRLSLANSMCDSRLLFGVESWPCCTGGAIQKLHVQRMKWLRSIDSSEIRTRDKEVDCSDVVEQSTEHKEPEQDVLGRLEQNHTTV